MPQTAHNEDRQPSESSSRFLIHTDVVPAYPAPQCEQSSLAGYWCPRIAERPTKAF